MPLNLPNALSLLRVPLAIMFVMSSKPLWQGAIIVAAGATDCVDGWLARRYQQHSRRGELIDPVTDKLFVFTVLLTLYLREQLRGSELLLLMMRDFYNTGAYILSRVRGWPLRFQARMSGKVVTVLQIGTMLAYTVVPSVARALLFATIGASVYSMYDYTRSGLVDLREARQHS